MEAVQFVLYYSSKSSTVCFFPRLSYHLDQRESLGKLTFLLLVLLALRARKEVREHGRAYISTII